MNHCAVLTAAGAEGAQARIQRHCQPTSSTFPAGAGLLVRCIVPALLLGLLPWSSPAGAQGVVGSPMPSAQTAPAGATAHGTTEYRLSNGLRLIVKEDHRAPTVAHQIWYRVGGIDEVSGTTGVAHMLEHMMFKGTPKVGVGEFSKQVAALGGRENALTNRDFTMYYQQIGKQYLPKMMELEADRMANLIIKKDEFDREMKVVMEERRLRTDDSSRGTVYEQLLATVYTAAAYRHPVIGWMDDLVNMRVEDVKDWYRQWYVPNNAMVIVTGDVKAEEVRALAERYYGKLKPRTLPLRKDQEEPEQKGIKRIWVKAPAENQYMVMAYKVPRLRDVEKDVDPYALEVLAAVLNGYDNARLTRELVREQRLADDVNVGYDSINRGESLFVLDGTPATGHSTEEIERSLRAEIQRIAREGVSPEELKRVKAQVVAGQIYKRDSVFGQGMEIGVSEVSDISWRQIDRMLDKIKAVTPAQVQAVASKYFNDDNLTVATLLPQPIDPNKPKTQAPSGLRH
ncbi:M16 family metallopeptidase [Cupriavidus consociatus]|uniref:M16 family metallopeptidase n=1 Tax=Cupriavidus consociatus TaxID=2821357 RepID=UPI001AE8D7A9|nr:MULTISPECIES: pitrilysin family protein [unclassified Cupriavidus]MBP0620025.1 insulinase family protein [Cupriavidus sp. LEh25]MDK2656680.1 pitrilysin family protein [Cupriavidus sp. LEh21]